MNKHALVGSLLLVLSSMLYGKSYALLVGIDKYKEARPWLQGAKRDAQSLYQTLSRQGVDDITILKDDEATRDAILSSLRRIAGSIQKDDRFYMFFSGHGTSLHDASFAETFRGDKRLLALMENSGALIPTDYSGKNPRETLIIGHRDLRPSFEKIDRKGAVSLVVFDACFSGLTARALPNMRAIRRHLVNPGKIHYKQGKASLTKRSLLPLDKVHFVPRLEHPYKHLIYVASTSTSDWAVEDKNTRRGYLTERVEQCLKGSEDFNRDQRIFRSELDLCLKNSNLPQAPQVYPQNTRLDPILIHYNISGAYRSSSDASLQVENTSGGYTVSDGYSSLQRFDTLNDAERFKKTYRIFDLQGVNNFKMLSFSKEDPDINRKTFTSKEEIRITVESDKKGYLALFTIDSKGDFYLLEPFNDTIEINASQVYTYADSEVAEPFGVDLMKGFLFDNREDLEKLRVFKTDRYGKIRDMKTIDSLYQYLRTLPKESYTTAFLKLRTQK